VVERAEPDPASASEERPGPPLDLDRLTEIWPAALETVRSANAMVGALLAEARPSALDGDRLTVSFPETAAFLKRKAEAPANRELVADTIKGLTGRLVAVAYELSESVEQAAPRGLGPDELLARLKAEFGAEEVFEDSDPDPEKPAEA
jgi:DNA polymerase-3 subunit gamma/tau